MSALLDCPYKPAFLPYFPRLVDLIGLIEWYTHSVDVKHHPYAQPKSLATCFYFIDDDEEASEDYDTYFNEYDWEVEMSGGRDSRDF